MFASRRAFLCLAATAVALPAWAADGPAAQLIEGAAAEVIQLIKTTKGPQLEADLGLAARDADELERGREVARGAGFPDFAERAATQEANQGVAVHHGGRCFVAGLHGAVAGRSGLVVGTPNVEPGRRPLAVGP